MSSTNRGSVREVSDYYATPQNVISDALRKFFELEYIDSVKDVLDPCAGGISRTKRIIIRTCLT